MFTCQPFLNLLRRLLCECVVSEHVLGFHKVWQTITIRRLFAALEDLPLLCDVRRARLRRRPLVSVDSARSPRDQIYPAWCAAVVEELFKCVVLRLTLGSDGVSLLQPSPQPCARGRAETHGRHMAPQESRSRLRTKVWFFSIGAIHERGPVHSQPLTPATAYRIRKTTRKIPCSATTVELNGTSHET